MEKQYRMIAANPTDSTLYVYLGCTRAEYEISDDFELEQTKLRVGAPNIAGTRRRRRRRLVAA